jgi:pyruvate dehydrogenase E2 component (dihydrolipoamide acetyltransferase)
MAKTIDIVVPDLGDFENVDVIEVLVGKGDAVERESGLITLETDKATMDIPAPENGVIESLDIHVGDTVSTGDVIGKLSIEVNDTVVITPALKHEPSGDTTVLADPVKGQGVPPKTGGVQTLVVPDLGDFEDVEIIEVHIAKGDTVNVDDPLVTLETDKAAMDVPAIAPGRIESVLVKVGDKVGEGASLAIIEVHVQADEEPVIDDESADAAIQPAAEQPIVGPQVLAVPDLGDFQDVEVIEVHVAPGDAISIDDPLVTLETDKAAMDVPAIAAGRVESVSVSVGDKVSEGSPLAVVEVTAIAPAEILSTQDAETPAVAKPVATTPGQPVQQAQVAPGNQLPPINEAGFSKAHASPSVRKLARELGVDLVQVKGSGAKNRILHDDVKAFVKAILSGHGARPTGPALPEVPAVDFAKFGEIENVPLTRVQKISGPRLQASWINLPHVTQHDLADTTDLESRRQELKGPAKERGISLTPLAFVMKACVAALQEYPKVNASLSPDGKNLVLKKYIHLGFAADTDNGLMVPVIRDADRKSVYELAQELGELSLAAREGKLKAEQMQGASFTVSSLGGIGGTAFTPIVNAPEVAILGVSRASMQPVWDGEAFKPRLMLPLSLSYDHRVIDGAAAVRFTTYLGTALADVETLLEGSEL